MRTFFLTLLLSVFSILTADAQTINTKKLDSLLTALNNSGLAMGSLAILVNGKMVYQKAIGFAVLDGDKKIAPTSTTQYRVGSVSKLFTAVMIFQLIDEKKLNLQQTLGDFFPQLPNAKTITIAQLLYHRSGLPDYTVDTDFPNWMDKPTTQEQLLNLIASKSARFEPGAKADYCNSNYLLLSYIIEKIDHLPYGKAFKKRILTTAGLENTYYAKPIDINSNESLSYKYADSNWRKEKQTYPGIHAGAGSITSTPADLVRFIEKLFAGKLTSKTSLNQMKTMVDDYGMGMFPYNFHNTQGYGHNGRIEEFYSTLQYYPLKKLAVSFICNGILYPRTDIVDGILKICFNEAYTIPSPGTLTLTDADFEKYTGVYSSASVPFKVVCKKENNSLLIEAAGQTMLAILISRHYFMNRRQGYFFDFDPKEGTLKVKETDNTYYFKKE